MAGHGGGAWKVAYADFVTAMMAFFMVMWITAQSKEVKQAIAHYFNEATIGQTGPFAAKQSKSSMMPKPEERTNEKRLPDPAMQLPPDVPLRKPKPNKPNMAVLHGGDQQIDGALVRFAEGSAELTREGKEQLNRLVPLLLGKRFKIEVRGHATRSPLPPGSPYRDAWHLSYERCVATMNFMEAAGIEPDRFRLSQAGPFEPFTLRVELAKQGQNSRVEVCPLNEVVEEFVGTREERAELYTDPTAKPPTSPRASRPSNSGRPAGGRGR